MPDDQFVPSPQLLSVACDSTKDVHFHALMAAEPCANKARAVGQAQRSCVVSLRTSSIMLRHGVGRG